MAAVRPKTRVLTALLLMVAAVSLTPATSTAAKKPSLMAYRGLGAWVDIYDDQAWDDPEGTVLAMAGRGVRTLYLETCNFSCKNALFRPHRMARLLTAAHAVDMRVVAWYLPGFDKPVRDYNRSMKAIEFETVSGDRFDSFALDIEAKVVKSASTRNARALKLVEDIRQAVGPSYPLGAITPPWYWDWPFPYAGVAQHVDVFLPMAYSSFRVSGARATHMDIVRNIEAVRQGTGQRNIPIHLIGGIADGLDKKETRAVVRAVREHGLLGASLYDYFTSSSEDWTQLARVPVNPRQSPALPVKVGREVAMGNTPGGDRSHPKEVLYRTGGRKDGWKVRFEVFDAQPGEVALWVNWRKVGDVTATPEVAWKQRTMKVPAAWLHDDRTNRIAFIADGPFPIWRQWGVRDVKLLKT